MPAKTTTIRTAEKRVIKGEIRSLKKARREIDSAYTKELNRITAVIRQADMSAKRAMKKLRSETASVDRRISILQGRL
jgi:ribosomal protein L20